MDDQDKKFIRQFCEQYGLDTIATVNYPWTFELFLQEYLKSKERRVKDAHALAAEQLQAIAMKHGKGRR